MIALHGKGGNAASFEAYMRPLVEASAETWEWEFLEGPHSTGGSGRAWWNLPPGVRTFEATELDGADESSMLDDAWPFDGIPGFVRARCSPRWLAGEVSAEGTVRRWPSSSAPRGPRRWATS